MGCRGLIVMGGDGGGSGGRGGRMEMRMGEEMGVEKCSWKWGVRMGWVVVRSWRMWRMGTGKRMGVMGGRRVRRIVWEMIWERMMLGVGGMGGGMGMWVVGWFRVRMMILESGMGGGGMEGRRVRRGFWWMWGE